MYKLLLVLLLTGCGHGTKAVDITAVRPCSTDQSSPFFVKARGACNIAGESCLLRKRLAGSEDPWVKLSSSTYDRTADTEYEFSIYCR
jgi:hypothetical protein